MIIDGGGCNGHELVANDWDGAIDSGYGCLGDVDVRVLVSFSFSFGRNLRHKGFWREVSVENQRQLQPENERVGDGTYLLLRSIHALSLSFYGSY